MCLYMRTIDNRRYMPSIKNGGIVPRLPLRKIGNQIFEDTRVKTVPIPCGNCMECRKKKSREWTVRLTEEVRQDYRGIFVTFTFNTKQLSKLRETVVKAFPKIGGYEIDNRIAKLAVRRFCERWRKKYKKSIKHWFVTELGHGEWEHMHIHGFIWTEEQEETIKAFWKYGNIWTSKNGKTKTGRNGYVNEKTVNYCTKYMTKIDKEHKYYKALVLCSPGIGKGYIESTRAKLNEYKEEKTDETYRTKQNRRIALPTYYRNKLYNEYQRLELWRDKLDKGEIWVCGEMVKTHEEAEKLRRFYRQLNTMLGYGDNKRDWEKWQEENERRNTIYWDRCVKRRKQRGQSITEEMERRALRSRAKELILS